MLASSIVPTVLLPVWMAVALWFIGAMARPMSRMGSAIQTGCSKHAVEHVYAWSWLLGSLSMWIHIFASYAVVYDWSHSEALRATAEESEQVTGIRAGWGVYVNFAFAVVWSVYSVSLVRRGVRNVPMDRGVYWFTAGIVLMATVVFEAGLVRVASVIGFCAVGIMSVLNAGRD